MGSTRLPGKSMKDLCGAPLIVRIFERVKRCNLPNDIVLATTDKNEDDILEKIAYKNKIKVFRGSELDLVDRYYQAAKKYCADVIVRFPADNPVPESYEIDRIIKYHLQGRCDFSTNLCDVLNNGYPDGIGAEVFNFNILEEIWRTISDPILREHFSFVFYDYYSKKVMNPNIFSVGTVQCPVEFRRPDLVLDVNTKEEYLFMKRLYEDLYHKNTDFTIRDIINWYDSVYSK